MRHAAAALSVLVVAVAAGAGLSCGGGEGAPRVPGGLPALPGPPASSNTHFSPDAARSEKGRSVIATARSQRVVVRTRPSAHARGPTLRGRRFDGRRLPLVFLVKRSGGGWVQAYLPTRPNRATGWIRAREVR